MKRTLKAAPLAALLSVSTFASASRGAQECRDLFDPSAKVISSLSQLKRKIETLSPHHPGVDELYARFAETFESALALGLRPERIGDFESSADSFSREETIRNARPERTLKSHASRSAGILRHHESVPILSAEFQRGTPWIAIRSVNKSFLFNHQTFLRQSESPDGLIAISPDLNSRALSEALSRSVRIVSTAPHGESILKLPDDLLISHLNFDLSGRFLFVQDLGALRLFDLSTGEQKLEIPFANLWDTNSDSTRLIVADQPKRLRVFDLPSGKSLSPISISYPENLRSLRVARDGRRVILVGDRGEIAIVHLTGRFTIRVPSLLSHPESADLSADNRTLAVAAQQGVEIWDAGTLSRLAMLSWQTLPTEPSVQVRFIDNRRLVVIGDRGLSVYETAAETAAD